MFCSKCGNHIPDNATFCPSCGQPVAQNVNAQQAFNDFSKKVDDDVNAAIKDFTNQNTNKGYQVLSTNRSLISYILLSFITCGIYGFYFIYKLAQDVNIACADDGSRTPGLATYIILSFITCGFYSFYWEYKIGNRIAQNAPRYGLVVSENGTSILMWRIFGMLLCGIGSFVGLHILIKNANTICAAYNQKH